MKNIILSGLMGCGKSSVGIALKEFFPDFILIETDNLIEEQERLSINEIFNQKGEEYFRKIESNIIKDILKNENQIISLGGGSLENDFDWTVAKKTSEMFYLKAETTTLYERIKNDTKRPLINCNNPKDRLDNLLKIRKINYEKADYTVDVNNKNVKDIAKEIKKIYESKQ